jgi:copper chaperone
MMELTLPTMTCGHCVRAVSETVRRVDAAAKVDVDLPAKTVRIESQHARQEFERALAEQGYEPAP